MEAFKHKTVLLKETVDELRVKSDGIYVDATLGGGGHTSYLLSQIESGKIYAFDQDQVAHDHAEIRLKSAINQGKLVLVKDNFRHLKTALLENGVKEIDGILYDLGVSSPQFDQSDRGFSYKLEAELDMRMDRTQTLTAYKVVNTYSFQDLVSIFTRYGEEPFAKSIARKIEKERQVSPIRTTGQLTTLIKSVLPQKILKKKGHPAKQVFQAIRIEVNDELGAISESLIDAIELVKPGGRLSVISFHSLEDRLVKRIFKENANVEVPKGLPLVPEEMRPKLLLVNRKPIRSSQEEIHENNRAHSAKLRVAEKRVSLPIKDKL